MKNRYDGDQSCLFIPHNGVIATLQRIQIFRMQGTVDSDASYGSDAAGIPEHNEYS